jgi:hypothetical protein
MTASTGRVCHAGAESDSSCDIGNGILEGSYLAIIFFRYFDTEHFVNPLDPTKNVHRIEVELIPQVRVVFDLFVGKIGGHVG